MNKSSASRRAIAEKYFFFREITQLRREGNTLNNSSIYPPMTWQIVYLHPVRTNPFNRLSHLEGRDSPSEQIQEQRTSRSPVIVTSGFRRWRWRTARTTVTSSPSMIGARLARWIEIKLNVSTSYNDSSCRRRDSHSSLTHIFAIAFHRFSRLFGIIEINVGIAVAPMHAAILKNIDFLRLTRRRKELQSNRKRDNELPLLSNLIMDGTFRISSSTTVYGIPRIFIWNSSDRLEETGERRTGLRLRVRRRWLS